MAHRLPTNKRALARALKRAKANRDAAQISAPGDAPGREDFTNDDADSAPETVEEKFARIARSDADRTGFNIYPDDPPDVRDFGAYFRWKATQIERTARDNDRREGKPNSGWSLSELLAYGSRNGLSVVSPAEAEHASPAALDFMRVLGEVLRRLSNEARSEHERAAPTLPFDDRTEDTPDAMRNVSVSLRHRVAALYEDQIKRNGGFMPKMADVARALGVSPPAVTMARRAIAAECIYSGKPVPAWAQPQRRGRTPKGERELGILPPEKDLKK